MRRLLYLLLVVVATACSYSGAYPGHGFDEAEALLHSDPAAALEKLNAYDLTRFDDSAAMARWACSFRSSRRQCSKKAYSTVEVAFATPMRSQKLRMETGV